MAEYIVVKNWAEYQHYKDRAAPWIKLHKELLSSHFWVMGNDASRLLAICIMLLAQRTDNKIPHDLAYIKRFANLDAKPDLTPLMQAQFIEIFDDAGCLQDASTALATCPPDKSRVEENRVDKKRADINGFDEFWNAYPNKTGKLAASKSWQKMNPPIADVLVALAWQRKSDKWTKDNGQFIEHATTYLNGARWRDEPVTVQPIPTRQPFVHEEPKKEFSPEQVARNKTHAYEMAAAFLHKSRVTV